MTILSNLSSTTVLTYTNSFLLEPVYGPFRVEIRTIKQLKSHSTKLLVPKGFVFPSPLNCCLILSLNFRLRFMRSCHNFHTEQMIS